MRSSFRGPRLTISLLTGLVVLLIVGGGAAMAISNHRGGAAHINSAAAPADSTVPAAATMSAVSTAAAASALPTTGPTSVSGEPATSDGPSNNLTVQLSPAVERTARALDVQQLLQSYFDAINQHNYAGWTQTVTDKMAGAQNSAQWLDAYATTVDSSIWMQTMNDDPLQVGVHFTSQQDPDLAPKDLPVACIDWTIGYQIESQHGRLVVGQTVPGSVTMAKC